MAIAGLVDYNSSEDGSGSGSGSESESGTRRETKSNPSTQQSILEADDQSIPPSSSSNQLLPPPRKKLKPSKTRILLDLPPIISAHSGLKVLDSTSSAPPSSNQANVEPQFDLISKLKSSKPNFSSTKSKKSGLASMLPPPKRIQPTVTSQEASLGSNSKPSKTEELNLNRPNPKASFEPSDEPILKSDPTQSSFSSSSSCLPSTKTEALNLFGLPALEANSKSLKPTTTTDSAGTVNSLVVSSAPQVTEEQPPEPSLLDPYPGYWQRKDGSWVARDPEEPTWKAFYRQHYGPEGGDHPSSRSQLGTDLNEDRKGLPKDFFKDSPNQTLVDFDAQKVARAAWENKPKIIDPREEARREQEALMGAKPAKHASARARGRHQLSCLLTEAQSNRAELEDRIARGKLNRKAGGAKYGF